MISRKDLAPFSYFTTYGTTDAVRLFIYRLVGNCTPRRFCPMTELLWVTRQVILLYYSQKNTAATPTPSSSCIRVYPEDDCRLGLEILLKFWWPASALGLFYLPQITRGLLPLYPPSKSRTLNPGLTSHSIGLTSLDL